MNRYEATCSIRLSRAAGGRVIPAGHVFRGDSNVADGLGEAEIKRLVKQGTLKVIGMPDHLEPGSNRLSLGAPPVEVEYQDAAGTKGTAAPTNIRGKKELEIRPIGRQTINPAALKDKSLKHLNALVADVDPNLEFGPGEEADAIRFLTQDHGAVQHGTKITGEADPKKDDGEGGEARIARAH